MHPYITLATMVFVGIAYIFTKTQFDKRNGQALMLYLLQFLLLANMSLSIEWIKLLLCGLFLLYLKELYTFVFRETPTIRFINDSKYYGGFMILCGLFKVLT